MFWKWSQVQSWLQTEDCGVLDQIASVKMFFFFLSVVNKNMEKKYSL